MEEERSLAYCVCIMAGNARSVTALRREVKRFGRLTRDRQWGSSSVIGSASSRGNVRATQDPVVSASGERTLPQVLQLGKDGHSQPLR